MSKPIVIKFDNSLPDKEIHKILMPYSTEEGGTTDTDMSEVKMTGVYSPLVKFNNRVIPWADIRRMTLTSEQFLPSMSLTFIDRNNISANLDTPGPDNEVILEILSPFDNIYKKIKLTFFIKNIHTNSYRNEVSVDCIYYVDGLNSHLLEAFGKKSTYEVLSDLAKRLKLGLCSNVDDTNDPTWIYAADKSPLEMMKSLIASGGTQDMPIDGWIDWWNNVNIIDIRDAYDGPTDDNLSVWTKAGWIDVDPKNDFKPVKVEASITNDYRLKMSSLYTATYQLINNTSKNISRGTDRVITSWDTWRELPASVLLQDGSGVKEKVFTTYVYAGEFNGEESDGKYLSQPEVNNIYKQKISNSMIRVCLQQPCLGLMRGHRVNVKWYDQSDMGNDIYDANKGMTTNIPLDDDLDINPEDMTLMGSQRINKTISGQYYIVNTSIEYVRDESAAGPRSIMVQWLTLARNMKSYRYSDAVKENNI